MTLDDCRRVVELETKRQPSHDLEFYQLMAILNEMAGLAVKIAKSLLEPGGHKELVERLSRAIAADNRSDGTGAHIGWPYLDRANAERREAADAIVSLLAEREGLREEAKRWRTLAVMNSATLEVIRLTHERHPYTELSPGFIEQVVARTDETRKAITEQP